MFFTFWGFYLFMLPTGKMCIILYMCASDTLACHSSAVCANYSVCNGPCTNTAWNYILPLFPFLAYYLSEERITAICGLQSLIFIKANWNYLQVVPEEKLIYSIVSKKCLFVPVSLSGFPVTLVGLENAIICHCYQSPPKGACFKGEKYCI